MKVPLVRDTIDEKDISYLIKWLETNPKLTKGDRTIEFEKKWSEYIGVKHSVYVNSGSSANLAMAQTLNVSGKLRNKIIENIENYKKNKDIVDSNYGSMFDSDTKAKLVWLMTNQDQWNARSREYINKIVSTSGDEKLSTSDVIMNLASKQMDSYDKNSKMMSSIQNEIIQLTLARDTTDPQQRRAILKNYGIKEGQIAKEIDNRKAEAETLWRVA